MSAAVDRWLESLEAEEGADRRNGYYKRHFLTELGDIAQVQDEGAHARLSEQIRQ
jgi:hypothetical protein